MMWSFINNCLSFINNCLKLWNDHHTILTLGGIIAMAAILAFEAPRLRSEPVRDVSSQLAKVDAQLTKVDALLQRADRTLDLSPQLTKVDALLQRADRTLDRVDAHHDDRRPTHLAKRVNARAPHSTATKTKFGNTRAALRERELLEWAATSAGRAMRSKTAPRELVEAVTAFRDALE
jgi:hypothetical protein